MCVAVNVFCLNNSILSSCSLQVLSLKVEKLLILIPEVQYCVHESLSLDPNQRQVNLCVV